jgi:hypothetical protein
LIEPFDDPQYAPPAALTDAESRAYETTILEMVRKAMPSGTYGSWRIESIELGGQRPETAVVFRYRDMSNPRLLLEARAAIWEDIIHTVGEQELIDDAPSVAGWIYSDFTTGELDAREIGE